VGTLLAALHQMTRKQAELLKIAGKRAFWTEIAIYSAVYKLLSYPTRTSRFVLVPEGLFLI